MRHTEFSWVFGDHDCRHESVNTLADGLLSCAKCGAVMRGPYGQAPKNEPRTWVAILVGFLLGAWTAFYLLVCTEGGCQ